MNGLGEGITEVLQLDPAAPAIEFEGSWDTWGDLAATAATVRRSLADLGLGRGVPIGVLLANRPSAIGFLLGVLQAEACVVSLNPQLGARRVLDDVERLRLPLVAGDAADVAAVGAATLGERAAVLSTPGLGGPATFDAAAEPVGEVEDCSGVAVRMLTSGTTGPPKRVDLSYRMLERVMEGAKHYESAGGRATTGRATTGRATTSRDGRLRQGVVIVNSPLVHLGGVFRVLQGVLDGRMLALLPRFTVDGWVAAVRRHRPKTVSLVPTALRMVLDADVPPEVFAGVRSVVSGTAALDPEIADAFTARYGVPVLTAYAATEFGGGVAGWNVSDYQQFWKDKRGSVGRAHAGCQLRVVDQSSGRVLTPGEVGLLEVQAYQLDSTGWVRTNDLAHLDADGFLWIVGRADQTIVRGGMKVQPDVVRTALERLPGVRGAAVIGLDDDRLGQVPVALVERAPGAVVREDELLAQLGRDLARYELPVQLRVVDELPRTASAKVDLAAVRILFASPAPGEG